MAPSLPRGALLSPLRGEKGAPRRLPRRLHAPATLGPGGTIYPCHPTQSRGEVEVGATAGSLDPPEVAVGGATKALGPWSHSGRSCHDLPPAAGAVAGRPPVPPVTPGSRGRAGCIAYVCQDLFPHIC
jgi:hypothetical protein